MSEDGATGGRGQLSLSFDAREAPRVDRVAAAERLADEVSARLGERVRLVVHDNRHTMVSFRRERIAVQLRVHHLFLGCPPDVADALAGFVRPGRRDGRRAASRRIDAWVAEHRERIAPPRTGRLQSRGRVHDLQAILDRLNAEQFDGAVEARIGWGRSGALPGRTSIRTGVYLHAARAIRIHPALDREEVPEFYVASVVFHEMLHQVVPPAERGGRRTIHGREFRRRERAYPDHARAMAWEKANVHLLLASPRRR
ncbi:MAG TPA: SprT-like domain-containing protein [Anaeromyxobacteraceae bacterium]|nr:SprT-like domain-containing protein [Anaeromyxobacteraceae bacterium]